MQPNLLDRPAPMRPGEELDLARLEPYLRAHFPEAVGPLTVEQFPQGYSNLTYLVRLGDRDLVLRRPPFGNQVKTAHDMGREFRVLSHLCDVYPPAPRPLLACDDPEILGCPFYLMERRRGIILRKELPTGLQLGPAVVRRLSETFVDNLAELHSLDYQAAGLADLGKPEGYLARQVAGWTQRYQAARTEDVASVEATARWLADHLPASGLPALIHNDYKYDNLVLDPNELTRLVAVLDWEMATVGDPLSDLGTTLGYWVEADDPPAFRQFRFGPTAEPGSLTRRELVARYAELTGRDVSGMLFYYVLGLFKIAVIVQQIYARYLRGHTRDERFAGLHDVVVALGEAAHHAVQRGSL